MEYNVDFNGNDYSILPYSFAVASKIENVEKNNISNASFKDKCKKMYDFCSDVMGAGAIDECLGKFDKADPNNINILYLSIVNTYNKPLSDFNAEKTGEVLSSDTLEQLTKILAVADKVSELQKAKK